MKSFITQEHRTVRYVFIKHSLICMLHPFLWAWCCINIWNFFNRMILRILSQGRKHVIQTYILIFIKYKLPTASRYCRYMYMTVYKRRHHKLIMHINTFYMCRCILGDIFIFANCQYLIITNPKSICPLSIYICGPNSCIINNVLSHNLLLFCTHQKCIIFIHYRNLFIINCYMP